MFNYLAMYDQNSDFIDLITVIPIAGMVIVFIMLVLLVVIISMFGTIMKNTAGAGKVSQPKATAAPVFQPQIASEDEDEIIAVIAAAVDAMYSTPEKKVVVKSVRPSVQSGRSVWAQAGVRGNVRAF